MSRPGLAILFRRLGLVIRLGGFGLAILFRRLGLPVLLTLLSLTVLLTMPVLLTMLSLTILLVDSVTLGLGLPPRLVGKSELWSDGRVGQRVTQPVALA